MPRRDVGGISEPLDNRHVAVLREIRGMTQEQLAKAAEINRSKLSSIENGEKGIDREVREKLARGLGISVRVLEQTSEFIRHVDREAGVDWSWTREAVPDRAGPTTGGDGVGDSSAATRRAIRRRTHRRIAESVGRATEALVYEHLEAVSEATYDDL